MAAWGSVAAATCTPAEALHRFVEEGKLLTRIQHPNVVETYDLGTVTTHGGTIAFLVGLGWWQGARFRQVQLLLPDHAYEPALLDELRSNGNRLSDATRRRRLGIRRS